MGSAMFLERVFAIRGCFGGVTVALTGRPSRPASSDKNGTTTAADRRIARCSIWTSVALATYSSHSQRCMRDGLHNNTPRFSEIDARYGPARYEARSLGPRRNAGNAFVLQSLRIILR